MAVESGSPFLGAAHPSLVPHGPAAPPVLQPPVSLRARMGGVVRLGQVRVIKPGVDLRGGDVGAIQRVWASLPLSGT